MSDKVKQLAPVIWEEIQKAKKILLHLHPNPDHDSAGSVLAMMWFLKDRGKDVLVISGDSELTKSLAPLPGFEQIKNANYFDIDPKQFSLFLIMDSSAPQQVSRKGGVVFPESMTTVVIDHHDSNINFGKINLVDINYPSTTQLVYDLLNTWGAKISPEIALNLFVGTYTDTGGFKYPKTSAETLLMASRLAEICPDFSRIIFDIENSYEPENIKYLGLALSSIELYFSGQVPIATVPYQKLQQEKIEKRHTSKMEVSNILKSVNGWNIGIVFTETNPGTVDVSLRTRNPQKYDLSKLAVALGGGGHAAAAGATVKKPFSEAKKFLLQQIAQIYPELGKP